MTYKALFLDIDGTILKLDHTYTDLTKQAIIEAKNNGLEVFLATGRPLHEIKDLANELSIDSFISYNGSYAVRNNEVIFNEPMNKSTVQQLVTIAKEQGHEMTLYTNGKNYFTNLDDAHVQRFIEIFQMNHNAELDEDHYEQVLALTVMKLKPEHASLYEIEPNLRLSQVNIEGAQHAYDILRNNVNKGIAIQHVLDTLNIPSEQAIAFGDGMNDIEMFQTVGASFVMENAHPDVFQYATYKTASVDDSGIYVGLKKLGVI